MLDVEHNRLTSLPLCLGQRSGLCVLRLGHNSLQQLDFLLPSNRHVGAGIARGGIAGGDFDSSTMGLLKLHTLEAQCNELTEVSVITRTPMYIQNTFQRGLLKKIISRRWMRLIHSLNFFKMLMPQD